MCNTNALPNERANMLNQGLSVVDVNFIDSNSAQLRDSQSRNTPTRVRHAPVLSPFDGNHVITGGAGTPDKGSNHQIGRDDGHSRSGAASGALKSRSPVKISMPASPSSTNHDSSDVLLLRQQLAALRKDVVVLQVSFDH